jgi:tetratricopeptide (TPR) repeat protein
MTHELIDDLRAEIADGNVLVVVGAGVSMGATPESPCASWHGLLENGVERCMGVMGLEVTRANLIRNEIRSGHMDDLLSAAEKISRVLGFPTGIEYRRWLRDAIGSLQATNRSVLEALRDLGSPLATTNYDSLLEQVTSYPPVTWRDGDKAIRVIRREEPGILHLHGHWDKPDSVVLGIRSYEEILYNGHAQAVLRALRTLRTLLFVGCGEGLADPNFGALLRWGQMVLHEVGSRHYRLCLESELVTLHALQRDSSLCPVSYGADHDSLGPFLRTLRPASSQCSEAREGALNSIPARTFSPRLPPRPPCFGRDDEVRDLVETLLQPSPPPTPILGGPGAGKTTITLAALHEQRVAERFGPRRFFVRCDSAKNREDLVGAIVSTIGLQPGPDVEGSLFEELHRIHTVLVLDNAETPLEGMDQAAVREILADLGHVSGLALVASVRGQERPWGPNWREAIRVGPLQADAARQAFLDKSEKRFENDPELDSLLDEVDRLAIAVVLLGYHAQALDSLAELRRQWQAKKTALLQRDGGQGRHENIEVSVELSVRGSRMTEASRRLLSVLAYLPDGVAEADLETLLPGDGGAAALVLRKVGLAFMQGGRIRVLAPIRECVRRGYPPKDEDVDRTLKHYLQLARQGDRAGRERGAEVVARLVPELGNVDSMIARGLEKTDPEPSIGAAVDLGKILCLSGWPSSTPVERALEKARETGRDLLQANCAEQLGDIALDRCDYDTARARYERALLLYSRIGSPLGEANCLVRLGDIAVDCIDYVDARARYADALTYYRRIGSTLGEAICIRRLGDIALACSDYDIAHAHYEEALSLFHEAGDLLGAGNCIQGSGDVALRHSRFDAASALFKEALELYQRLHEPYSVGWTLVRLARLAEEGSKERQAYLEGARLSFESIKRLDFVEELREEFGEILAKDQ